MIWRQMSSAPKDREIMGRVMAFPPFPCQWDEQAQKFIHWCPEDGPISYEPTHWADKPPA